MLIQFPEIREKLERVKLVALDMDGTLLPDNKRLSAYTVDTLWRLKKAGYTVCICSGRSFPGVYKYSQLHGIISYYICFEGGFVVDNTSGEPRTMYSLPVPRECLHAVVAAAERENVMTALLCDQFGYCANCRGDIVASVRVWGAVPIERNYSSLRNLPDAENVYIALIYGSTDRIDAIVRDPACGISRDFDVINTYLGYKKMQHLILKARDVNKFIGIERVLRALGLSSENLMAFGDWHNDSQLIAGAGVGVAMKNAEREILDLAYFVTEHSNNHDGVARFIDETILA